LEMDNWGRSDVRETGGRREEESEKKRKWRGREKDGANKGRQ